MRRPVVVYDACVLYCAPVRDILIRLANAGLVQARWSDLILDECFRSIQKNRPDLSGGALSRTRGLMIEAVRDCMVADFEDLIDTFSLPDPDDRHVLAAAIKAQADAIVTFNLRDFPSEVLEDHALSAISPDSLVLRLLAESPDAVMATVIRQAAALRKPARTVDELLEILAANGLTKSAAKLQDSRDVRNVHKPFVEMDDLESVRAWDHVQRPMVQGFLNDARGGSNHFSLAAAVLLVPRLPPLMIYSQPEYGDDGGVDLVREHCQQLESILALNETLQIELVTGHLERDGSWTCVSQNLDYESFAADESPGRVEFEELVANCRAQVARESMSVAVLETATGEKRVAFYDWDAGDGEGRANTSNVLRQCRRLALLKPKERLEHVSVDLFRDDNGWRVSSTRTIAID